MINQLVFFFFVATISEQRYLLHIQPQILRLIITRLRNHRPKLLLQHESEKYITNLFFWLSILWNDPTDSGRCGSNCVRELLIIVWNLVFFCNRMFNALLNTGYIGLAHLLYNISEDEWCAFSFSILLFDIIIFLCGSHNTFKSILSSFNVNEYLVFESIRQWQMTVNQKSVISYHSCVIIFSFSF